MSRKLCCARCGKKVDVVTKNDYVTRDGFLYCNNHCFVNRFIPMDISKPDRKKLKKKKPCLLYVVENNTDYSDLRDEVGFRNSSGVDIIILTVGDKTHDYLYTWYNRSYKDYAIKNIEYRTELSIRHKTAIDDIKRLSNARH